MLVSSIINAIIHRVGKQVVADFGEPFILDTLNRKYHEANEEYRALQKEYTFDFSTVTDVEDTPYMSLPSDLIYPSKLVPFKVYRDFQIFSDTEPDTWSINMDLDRFLVAGVAADDSFVMTYYGSGKTLVNETEAVYAAQSAAYKLLYINYPEWKPDHLHSYLIYVTALELSPNYPLMARDEVNLAKLTAQLDRKRYLAQLAHPNLLGEQERRSQYESINDPYAIE